MIIDCEQCTAAPVACGDCVVSVLLGMPGLAEPVAPLIADEHLAAVSALAESGLIPPLRLVKPATDRPSRGLKRRAG
ncbi:MAG TPA: hypothetical protein DDY88_05405 [Actinobacteria bacterium]|nr:hypothetical protein [Actinomycetota bacterium]